jgi:hypothetical protein
MSDEVSIAVSIPLDSDGFLRRECPTCEREFKWWVSKDDEASTQPEAAGYCCPYCAIQAAVDTWHTQAQVDYIEAIGRREVVDPLLKKAGFDIGGNVSAQPPELKEDDDMTRVDFACHPEEPVKVLDGWAKPVHCLICGMPAAD